MAKMWERPLVYVAGPYTHPDPVINVREACETATKIVETGLACAIVPHPTLLWHLTTPKPVEFWYELDLAHLKRCDALYRFPGASSGADAEVEFAVENDIPVFTDWYSLITWLREWWHLDPNEVLE